MNISLYKTLLSYRSYSKSEEQIVFRNFLIEYITRNYINVECNVDEYGNLYVEKKTTEQEYVNCVVAHLDINQKTKSNNISIIVSEQHIIGLDENTGLQIGLGHDDKAGVYFALQALKRFDNIKVFFPLDEEVGLVGARNSYDPFFENVGFFLQLDRRGYTDISKYTNGNDVVTLDTMRYLNNILFKYNFKWVDTVSTDIGFLVPRHGIQGTNISCGYLNEHMNTEFLNHKRYDTCQKFGMEILKKTNGKVFKIEGDIPLEKKEKKTTEVTKSNLILPLAKNNIPPSAQKNENSYDKYMQDYKSDINNIKESITVPQFIDAVEKAHLKIKNGRYVLGVGNEWIDLVGELYDEVYNGKAGFETPSDKQKQEIYLLSEKIDSLYDIAEEYRAIEVTMNHRNIFDEDDISI